MTGEPTEAELRQLAIDEARSRHTPDISELPVRTCAQMIEGLYGKCDGRLEVMEVSAAYDDYRWAFVRCRVCWTEMAIPNPRRIDRPAEPQTTRPDWRNRRDIGDSESEFPF